MKKILVFILMMFCCLLAFAQDCIQQNLGSKTLYKPQQTNYKAVPKGYQPILINYAGRHGARHLTKDVKSYYAYQLIMKADTLQALTDKGKRLKAKITLLDKVENGLVKSISKEGKNELAGIAARMRKNNARLFKEKPFVDVTITKEIRTKQSAEAFLEGWRKAGITGDLPMPINDTTLRFYDLSPSYIQYAAKGDWHGQIAWLKDTIGFDVMVKDFAAQFFTPNFVAHLSNNETEEFATDIYGFQTILYSVQTEIKNAGLKSDSLDLSVFITCEQMKCFDEIDEAEDYFSKGPAESPNSIQVNIAAPLLMDFIKTAADGLNTGMPNVQLRFTHAEAIAPLAALMGIEDAATPADHLDSLQTRWHTSTVIPLSANIQWIFYSNKNAQYLVKFLLNEKEVAIIDLPAKMFPYYNWVEVRAFYLAKLKALRLQPGDNMYRFLQNLR